MKNVLVPVFLLATATSVYAENVTSFAEADQDKDGILSVAEAKTALPDVAIEDSNRDGVVNKNEAAASIEGYTLARSDSAQAAEPVKEADYRMIVEALAKASPARRVSSNN